MKRMLAAAIMLIFSILTLGSVTRTTEAGTETFIDDPTPLIENEENAETPKPISAPPVKAAKHVEKPAEAESKPEPVVNVQNSPLPVIDETEYEMLACVIYQEAGGNAASDEARYMVGDVVLNRIADSRFPNTMEGVLTQESQYGCFHWTGIVWPDKAQMPGETAAVERSYKIAYDLLTDAYHSKLYHNDYIWQAEFAQGYDIVVLDGLYFGK